MTDNNLLISGEKVLSKLKEAKKMLSDSKTWGFRDLYFGSGGFTGYSKNSKLEITVNALDEAEESLICFMNEIECLSKENPKVGEYLEYVESKMDIFTSEISDMGKVSIILMNIEEIISRTQDLLCSLFLCMNR